MSVIDIKAKAPKKASIKASMKVQKHILKIALEAAVIEYVPLTDLAKSPLNVRTIPYAMGSVRGLADAIEALGLLQNLIVRSLNNGNTGVIAGGRRLIALNCWRRKGTSHRIMQ